MTEIQEILMGLMDEIDSVCKANDIKYALYGKTAGCAAECDEFTTGCAYFHIMVKSSDILKLKSLLITEHLDNRLIEDMSVNPYLSDNILRYVDANTTLTGREGSDVYFYPGIAVDIHPVYDTVLSKRQKSYLMINNMITAPGVSNSKNQSKRDFIVKHFRRPFAYKHISKTLYKTFSNKKRTDGKCLITKSGNKCSQVSIDMIEKTRLIDFEGRSFPVPQNPEKHYKAVYGEKWKQEYNEPYETASTILVFCDTKRGFDYYVPERTGFDLLEFQLKKNEYYKWQKEKVDVVRKMVRHDYNFAKYSAKRIDAHILYKDRIEELKKIALADDYTTLSEIMAEYLEWTDSLFETAGLGFYVNDELFDCASVVWKHTKDNNYTDMIKNSIPEEYLTNNIEEYLREYGV